MREQSFRRGSLNSERGEYRPAHSKPKTSSPRSRRATNLGRLGKVLGLDMLAAALGLSQEAIQILVDGRDHAREQQYAAHLAAKFKDAGIPSTWLDNPDAQVTPDYLARLRQFAAASSNKTPIRRANFTRLTKAFAGREEILADALEMIPSAVLNVAEGLLELDDGRFGHINPRLVRAEFPDGWLEQAEPDLTDAMLKALEQLATDDYERSFEELEQEQANYAGQVFINTVAPESQQFNLNLQPEAATSDTSKETDMTAPRQPKAAPQPPAFKAAGIPATKPMSHPSAGSRPLPRGMMSTGRPVAGATKPPVAPSTAQKLATPPKAMPVMANASATSKKKELKASTAAAIQASSRTIAQRNTVSKEVSMARAIALDELFKIARRGVKVTLWRDILKSSLPFWGNIRRGSVLFRDDLAEGTVKAMGLPEGWLDNPSFPPETLAAWVTDASAPMPASVSTSEDAEPTVAPETPKRDAIKPYAQNKAPAPGKVTMASKPPAKPPVFNAPAANTPVAPAPAAPAPVAAAPVAAAPVAAAPVPAPVAVPANVGAQPGPLCQALVAIITSKAAEGSFTENDALALITSLMRT